MSPFDIGVVALGLLGLWWGTTLTLSGALALTDRAGLSHGFVGLTVLAIGTDLPELLVAVSGGIQQLGGVEASGIVVGNAVGSAIAQGSLVLAVAGLIAYRRIAPKVVRRDLVVLLLCVGLVAALAADREIARWEGVALALAYSIYFVGLLQAEREKSKEAPGARESLQPTIARIVIGLVVVSVSAHVVVTGVVNVGETWGVSQTLLGVLILGLGTSLPELALSIGAAFRGQMSLSIGNIVGSNIFDLLIPVGVSGAIHPLAVETETLTTDLPALAILTLALLVFSLRKRGLQRIEALALAVLYVGFVVLRISVA